MTTATVSGFNNSTFIFFDVFITQPEAQALCESVGGNLARIEDSGVMDLIHDVAGNIRTFVGIVGNQPPGQSGASYFSFIDGVTEGLDFITDKAPGEYPWQLYSEPNNNNGENCVVLEQVSGLLNDYNCAWKAAAMCRVDCKVCGH